MELIRVLTKAFEDLGLAWWAQEEPVPSLLNEWYLKGHVSNPPANNPPCSCR